MRVSISYCKVWNYLPKASSLAASIEQALGIETEVVVGTRGQFDVVADGALLFSKQQEQRFPEPDEIIAALRRAGTPVVDGR